MTHGNKGKRFSKKHRQRIADALKKTAKIKRWGANKRGKKVSKKTRRKMSLSMRGNKNSLGVKRSEKEKEKIREKLRGRDTWWSKKEKHWNWKGGITPMNVKIRNSIHARLWRESVFARDNWTCQKCLKRGSTELCSHHVKNFASNPELRFAINNGVTLCENCHKKFHKKYGIKENTERQLEEFMEQNE